MALKDLQEWKKNRVSLSVYLLLCVAVMMLEMMSEPMRQTLDCMKSCLALTRDEVKCPSVEVFFQMYHSSIWHWLF